MLITCIGGPLQGQQVEVPENSRIYIATDCNPRVRYIALGKRLLPRAGVEREPSVAYFGLSTLEPQEVAEGIDIFESVTAISPVATKESDEPSILQEPHDPFPLYEVLYVSRFPAGSDSKVVMEIARQANVNNFALDVTGMLLFDGFRFSQQFEAPLAVLMKLLDRIRRDVRHFDIRLLHLGPSNHRRFEDFAMGYTAVNALDALEALGESNGPRAINAFMTLLPPLRP